MPTRITPIASGMLTLGAGLVAIGVGGSLPLPWAGPLVVMGLAQLVFAVLAMLDRLPAAYMLAAFTVPTLYLVLLNLTGVSAPVALAGIIGCALNLFGAALSAYQLRQPPKTTHARAAAATLALLLVPAALVSALTTTALADTTAGQYAHMPGMDHGGMRMSAGHHSAGS